MQPSLSIIIPVYNDPSGLEETLNCLVKQNFPKEQYEVIVVDNGSKDNTSEIGKKYAHLFPDTIVFVIENSVKGSYAARNRGIKVARGELLIFIDANITFDRDYIEKVNNKLKNSDIDYLGCNVKMKMDKYTISSLYDYINGFKIKEEIENASYTPTCNLVVRKEVILRAGNFDARLEGGGDFEFGKRVASAGFTLDYAEDIVLYHPTRSDYKSLIEKAMRIGRGNAQMAFYYPQKYKYLMNRHFFLQAFSPRNPLTYFSLIKKEEIVKRTLLSFLFSVYHIPAQLFSTIACLKKSRQLE